MIRLIYGDFMNYFKIDDFDSADGTGIRLGLYISGCTHKCKGCHSSMYWPFDSGKEFTNETLNQLEEIMKKDYINGLSILGGDPLEPENIHEVNQIINKLKNWYRYFHNDKELNVWLWTGSLFEDLILKMLKGKFESGPDCQYISDLDDIMLNIDVLVDGPFIEEKKDLNLAFRGSSNQRIIDVKRSLEECKIVLLDIKESIHG